MTTLATLEYAPIELAQSSISEELSKLKPRRSSKHGAALFEALQSADVSIEELRSLLHDPATAQLPAHIQGLAWALFGYALDREGLHAEVLEAFERATELRPEYPDAHFNRGMVLGQMGRYQEAIEAFEWYSQLRPDDPEAPFNRGVALAQLGRYQEALEALERVYPLRRTSSAVGQGIYLAASYISLMFGLAALKRRWLPDYEKATDAFIKWRARARRDKQTAAFKQAVEEVKNGLPKEDIETFEDFMLGVRLMSIRDPFKGWKALGKEISKDWPKDVSAVEAVREQRRW
ncbi:MAG: tetratricopeptide repeat protein [Dehalococcoidia bacterium]|nr:tetratricopeptide repeat protein [Dehalococcoidia bacterium]